MGSCLARVPRISSPVRADLVTCAPSGSLPKGGRGGAGWMLYEEERGQVRPVAWSRVPVVRGAGMSSYRAEAAGVLTVATFLHTIDGRLRSSVPQCPALQTARGGGHLGHRGGHQDGGSAETVGRVHCDQDRTTGRWAGGVAGPQQVVKECGK
eukprot:3902647-Pyramimonas_sp.AAC.2